jgi:mitochondrial translocator assembly and maintenance protein 41
MAFIELLRSHIKTPFMTAFAYGSGVFKQQGVIGNKMIDYLVVVEDDKLTGWHESNFIENPRDYPLLGKLAISNSKLFDEAVYYVPSVTVSGDKMIKYGVLGWGTLIKDLFTWDSIFLAGRLQKPTIRSDHELDEDMKNILALAMEYNLDSALNASILLNPRLSNDFIAILKGIVFLSYTNDPRLMIAESPQKVDNIVKGQLKELESMYLDRFEKKKSSVGFGDPMGRLKILNNLPSNLKTELLNESPSLWQVALNNNNNNLLKSAIGRIVRRSAWKQMILGSISTPLNKAASYAFDKVKKRFNKVW